MVTVRREAFVHSSWVAAHTALPVQGLLEEDDAVFEGEPGVLPLLLPCARWIYKLSSFNCHEKQNEKEHYILSGKKQTMTITVIKLPKDSEMKLSTSISVLQIGDQNPLNLKDGMGAA